VNSIDLAAERAASEERRWQKAKAELEALTPWARYCLYLREKYPTNPISYLYDNARSGQRVTWVRRPMRVGEEPDVNVKSPEDAGKIIMAYVAVPEDSGAWGHRISRAADSVSTFLHRLPEEDTFEAWAEREGVEV
jgi:hypothetical protein